MILSATGLRSIWLTPGAPSEAGRVPGGPLADIVVLDLAGGHPPVPPGALAERLAAARPAARHGVLLRLSPLSAGRAEAELDAIRPERPDGVLLSGCGGARDVQACGAKLAVREAMEGWEAGALGIAAAPDATGLLSLAGLAGASSRLLALVLEDDVLGPFASEAAVAAVLRTLLVLGARSAGVPAWDATGLPAGLPMAEACRSARRQGFSGRLTRDPALLAAIEGGFAPTLSAGG